MTTGNKDPIRVCRRRRCHSPLRWLLLASGLVIPEDHTGHRVCAGCSRKQEKKKSFQLSEPALNPTCFLCLHWTWLLLEILTQRTSNSRVDPKQQPLLPLQSGKPRYLRKSRSVLPAVGVCSPTHHQHNLLGLHSAEANLPPVAPLPKSPTPALCDGKSALTAVAMSPPHLIN